MQLDLKKAQRHSIDRFCASIRVIEELVPLEQKRFSKQRKRHLESAREWRRCEKMTPTCARQLTQADFEARSGITETREGPAPFAVEDYLALDDQGEYPIQQSAIEQCYDQIAPPDEQGFALYRSTEIREACQQFRAFTTDRGVAGLAGDYLMRGGDKQTWPCAKAKFEQEYRFVERKASKSMTVIMPQEDILLIFKEAMGHLRISRSTLYRLMWSGLQLSAWLAEKREGA